MQISDPHLLFIRRWLNHFLCCFKFDFHVGIVVIIVVTIVAIIAFTIATTIAAC